MVHMPGFSQWILVALIGLLFFGKRLPEVGKSVAGAIVNFKKGLKDAQEEISRETNDSNRPVIAQQNTSAPADAKFDPHTGEPLQPKPKFDPYTGKPIEPTVVTHGDPA